MDIKSPRTEVKAVVSHNVHTKHRIKSLCESSNHAKPSLQPKERFSMMFIGHIRPHHQSWVNGQ